jgi:hypothetical protein
MSNQQNPFPPGVAEALERGDLLAAIKLLRSSGFGLKEAKDALDAHMRAPRPATTDLRQRIDAPKPIDPVTVVTELSPGQVRGLGEGAWLVIAIVIGTIVAFLVT